MRRKIKAVRADRENFLRFGRFEDVKSFECFRGQGWQCWLTDQVCMNQPAHFGMTYVKTAPPYEVVTMERHTKTEELMVCGDGPIVVALADSDPAGQAKTEDIQAFILYPGEIIVIRKGIWHDACRALTGETFYYFLSLETDEPAVQQSLDGDIPAITL